jgi:hypothetical protein
VSCRNTICAASKKPSFEAGILGMAIYRGIEYRIVMRPGRDAWAWTIFPPVGNAIAGTIDGPRDRAVTAAMNAIVRVQKLRPMKAT